MKNTVVTFRNAKNHEKLAMLTAYDYTMAKLLDQSGVNALLVGDSLGMVMLGYESTLSVTMEDMIHHCAAVARGVKEALVVCDMPFMSYQSSVYDAVCNAGRLVKEGGAEAVKLEGGEAFCPHVKAIVQASIPVMAHLGLTPQSVNALGGYKVQGRSAEDAQRLVDDARKLEYAGAFAILLECVPAALATFVSEHVSVPVIGIGSGAGCDGQVLVYQDMLGMYDKMTPKFVKRFASMGDAMKQAFAAYVDEVKTGRFPAEEHAFSMQDDVIGKLY